jgi:3-oxoacyl-[acyl-carrier protein] reductase
MGKLDGKAAIITGGGTGIGRSIALTFAREGADVAVCGRTLSTLNEVADEIKTIGQRAIAITTDVCVKEQVQNMVKKTIREFGKIDILVNDAGIGRFGLIVDLPEEEWDAVVDTSLKGTFLCMQAVGRPMMERKFGRIINISSIMGMRTARPGQSAYCAAKAGVELLTKAATIEFTSYGIRVNCIAPGNIETPIYRKGRTQAEIDQWLASAKSAPIGRAGEAQEIANVALFLASEDSSFVCGECIVVDGGRNAKMA